MQLVITALESFSTYCIFLTVNKLIKLLTFYKNSIKYNHV